MNPPLRPLPIPLAPIHKEAIGSYLARLADANRIHIDTLSTLLIDRVWPWRRDTDYCGYWTAHSTGQLSALTTRTMSALTHALPALRDNNPYRESKERPSRLAIGFPQLRPVCRYCAARHGCFGMALRRYHSHEFICRIHLRGIGGASQFDLRHLPGIVEANHIHRRIAQRHGHVISDQAYLMAARQLADLFQHNASSQTHHEWWSRLETLGEDPYGDPLRPNPDRLELVTYPDAVASSATLIHHGAPGQPTLGSQS